MKILNYKLAILFILSLVSNCLSAQLKGVVTDSLTNEPLMYISVYYDGKGVGGVTNINGEYNIETRKGWNVVTFSSIGYKTKKVTIQPGQHVLNVKLSSDDVMLAEVVVKPKKERYTKKNNPAVDLMRNVVKYKRKQELEANDYYKFDRYEKMKMSLNNITDEKLENGIYKKYAFLKNHVEKSTVTESFILPFSVQETASQVIYRKDPESQKTIIKGMNTSGISELFATGEGFGTVLKDAFSNINIYDDEIRLLQRRFTSPISNEGINFYKYYIMDTIKVDNDSCYHLTFVPQNSQDFGFTGHLYVMKDSTYAVKRCTMNLPHKSGVNFVNQMFIVQNYVQLPNGNWALKDDDMTVDMTFIKSVGEVQVQRTTKYNNYDFSTIEPRLFRLKGSVIKEADMLSKDDSFWADKREVELTKTESTMDVFMNRLEQIPGMKYIIFTSKAFIENAIETGKKSKVDLVPVNTIVGKNFVEGWRVRLSAMTTANLNKHWYLSGYGAYGFGDKKWKYSGTLTYSFPKRDYVVWEFPQHYISATYSYDVMSPMDKFLFTDKDNVFVAFKTTTVDQMSYMRDFKIDYNLEMATGFGVKAMFRHRNDEPAGNLYYWNNNSTKMPLEGTNPIHDITTSELSVTLRYAPGETFVNSKERRIPVSLDAPIFTLTHTTGVKAFGGQYNFNRTEASIWKRVWLPSSWGKVDISMKAGAEWNTVPFPLLILPEANLSYITQRETFCLINNMEFFNDRFASLSLSYDMNGKLFNRIPLLKRLKWREMFRIRGLWGTLTDKNNPFKSDNPDLFLFPMRNNEYTSFVMDKKQPYLEASVGIYNIFKLLHVEYVRRLTYLDNPHIHKNGVRFMIQMVF
jgi:hypothetical protein